MLLLFEMARVGRGHLGPRVGLPPTRGRGRRRFMLCGRRGDEMLIRFGIHWETP